MPGFDRTGPQGKGSRTGRGLEKCNTNSQEDENKSQDDFEAGLRHGRGFGFGNRYGRGRVRR
jgi:hypothetical protein